MPYIVSNIDDIRSEVDETGRRSDSEVLEQWLNQHERDGFVLAGVVPGYHAYDESGRPSGIWDPLLIMHSDDP